MAPIKPEGKVCLAAANQRVHESENGDIIYYH